MAFRSVSCLRILKNSIICNPLRCASINVREKLLANKSKEFRTENNLIFYEDPDNFGTLTRKVVNKEVMEDEDDVKEEVFQQNTPLSSQKLTIKQYADLIKQFLKYKRLKEAIDVLEVRMLTQDRVKPENYIYNILIGACADVGYTKQAFKLFNDMKRRSLKPTGDTYTCLFTACVNSPWPADGLKRANNLRELMKEKAIEPNLTNYNAMIKAFGRCGDLSTAFMLVDEMISKNIKIRVHTFNHLLQACITDKNNGLRHALISWRKMLKMREKPNIYSFNLMLKCVKDCSLGSIEDIQEVIATVQSTILIDAHEKKLFIGRKPLELPQPTETSDSVTDELPSSIEKPYCDTQISCNKANDNRNLTVASEADQIKIEIVDRNVLQSIKAEKRAPNLLSKTPNMEEVLSMQSVHSVQDKFAMIGGFEDFLKEMATYGVKPDIKTFTQMLMIVDENREDEHKLIDAMKNRGVKADIGFYNMLIKKRCLRSDYEGAKEVMKLIKEENEFRKRRYPKNKKLRVNMNVMTYGVLAMSCKTKADAIRLLDDMKEKNLKINIEILGALLRQGTAHSDFGYVMHVMNIANEEKLKVNDVFLKHLEAFNDKCEAILKLGQGKVFETAHKYYMQHYKRWLRDISIEEVLKPEHPWEQFRDTQPETIQRQNIVIEEPKKYYKRKSRYYVKYSPIK